METENYIQTIRNYANSQLVKAETDVKALQDLIQFCGKLESGSAPTEDNSSYCISNSEYVGRYCTLPERKCLQIGYDDNTFKADEKTIFRIDKELPGSVELSSICGQFNCVVYKNQPLLIDNSQLVGHYCKLDYKPKALYKITDYKAGHGIPFIIQYVDEYGDLHGWDHAHSKEMRICNPPEFKKKELVGNEMIGKKIILNNNAKAYQFEKAYVWEIFEVWSDSYRIKSHRAPYRRTVKAGQFDIIDVNDLCGEYLVGMYCRFTDEFVENIVNLNGESMAASANIDTKYVWKIYKFADVDQYHIVSIINGKEDYLLLNRKEFNICDKPDKLNSV